jgi:hypothetical protein
VLEAYFRFAKCVFAGDDRDHGAVTVDSYGDLRATRYGEMTRSAEE